ncbi:hypothetical protein ACG02S_23130 [Roseateles sp. DC23W]|uniref:Uncharacterized protein n=1 Tax=Pelomonas dachongensis TaxID=3299029 RepID=A0ABW7ETP3_9BURK
MSFRPLGIFLSQGQRVGVLFQYRLADDSINRRRTSMNSWPRTVYDVSALPGALSRTEIGTFSSSPTRLPNVVVLVNARDTASRGSTADIQAAEALGVVDDGPRPDEDGRNCEVGGGHGLVVSV